jgi:hypothetical protein
VMHVEVQAQVQMTEATLEALSTKVWGEGLYSMC